MGSHINLRELQKILDDVQREYDVMKITGTNCHIRKVGIIGNSVIAKVKKGVVEHIKSRDSSW